ncbi:MAG: hypothetical protein G01um101419_249 [Parcubacteria group bacterium Gr01-1014_19]|nr:MAG: hypothetical protein G01um101419_249 [Parcubacteria group bacterium Gr01-1014_19]
MSTEPGQFYRAKTAGYGNEIIVFIEGDGLQFQQLEKKGNHWQRSAWRDVTELQSWVEHIGGHYTARLKGTQERITIYAVCDSYLKLTKAEGGDLWFEASQWALLSQLEDFTPCNLS